MKNLFITERRFSYTSSSEYDEDFKIIYNRENKFLGEYKLTKGLKRFDTNAIMEHPILAFVYNTGLSSRINFDKQQTLRAIDFWIAQVAYTNEVDYVMTDTVDEDYEVMLRELIETRQWILKQKGNTKFCKHLFTENSIKLQIQNYIQRNQPHQLKIFCHEHRYIERVELPPYDEIKSRRGYPFCCKVIKMSSRKYARVYKKKWEKQNIKNNPNVGTIIVNGSNENFYTRAITEELFLLRQEPLHPNFGGINYRYRLGHNDAPEDLLPEPFLLAKPGTRIIPSNDDLVPEYQTLTNKSMPTNNNTIITSSDWTTHEVIGTYDISSSISSIDDEISPVRLGGASDSYGPRFEYSFGTSGTSLTTTGATFTPWSSGGIEWSVVSEPKYYLDHDGVLILPEQVPNIVDTMLIGKKISNIRIHARRTGTP